MLDDPEYFRLPELGIYVCRTMQDFDLELEFTFIGSRVQAFRLMQAHAGVCP